MSGAGAQRSEDRECDVAIVVPVYRNAATLTELARRVASALAGRRSYRLVFVVDASPDESWGIVTDLARADARVGGVLLARNQGQHRALVCGLNEVRADMIAFMDADLQDPPELLPALFDECERAAVTVFARRWGRYQSAGRMLTSRLFKLLLGALMRMPADVGTYFVVPSAVAEQMRRADLAHVQVVVMARAFSAGWRGVRYVRRERGEGMSAYSGLARVRSAWRSLACAFECHVARRRGGPASGTSAALPVAARANVR